MSTGSFSGVKRPERVADHPPPSKCRGHERVGLYLYSPSGPQWLVIGRTFTFNLVVRKETARVRKVKMLIGGVCGMYGERRGTYRVLVVRPEGKRPLGRSRRRWDDNIKIDLKELF